MDLVEVLQKFEISFIANTLKNEDMVIDLDRFLPVKNDDDRDFHIIFKKLMNHKYEDILNMDIHWLKPLGTFLKETSPIFCIENGEVKSNFQNQFNSYCDNFTYVQQLVLLSIGIAALQEFVRANVCGPSGHMEETVYSIISGLLPEEDFSNAHVLNALAKDGETILIKNSHPKLLYLSLILFCSHTFEKCVTHKWWLLRSLFIQQRMLLEIVPDLLKSIISLVKTQLELGFLKNKEEPLVEIMFYTECAHIYLHYHEINEAEKLITHAQNVLGLSIELSGAIGNRTRFQSKAVAQLLAKSKRTENQYQTSVSLDPHCLFPLDLVLQDDTLLNKIDFIHEHENRVDEILPEEQIVILAHCCLIQKKMATTELKQEEVMSYINYLLTQPKVWSLHVKALIMRCQVEKVFSRKFERSLMQLEELINSLKRDEPSFSTRLTVLYCVAFPFAYELEKFLAELLISIGSVKSALEIYEKLQLWEDVVICYKELGMVSKAISLLEKLIADKPSPTLLCYLGDVTDDPEKYEIAWELSENKNARSQRSLGYYYLKRKDYSKSITHFTLSAEVNHLQPTLWFSLGYAATEVENFELAAKAYRHVVSLDHDNFEAWNNLSNAYIKMKQKVRAWRTLQEALKCNYEQWKVWENFILVSVDIGAFEDVIRAYHRLLDIKQKHVDTEILNILVNAIEKDLPDFNSFPSSRLKDKTLKLFGRLTSITTNNPTLWELYSILQSTKIDIEKKKDVLEKAVSFQHKAVSFYTKDPNWVQGVDSCKLVLKAGLRFAELCITFIQLLENTPQKQQQKSKAKYLLQSILTKTDKEGLCFNDDLQEKITTIKTTVDTICNL